MISFINQRYENLCSLDEDNNGKVLVGKQNIEIFYKNLQTVSCESILKKHFNFNYKYLIYVKNINNIRDLVIDTRIENHSAEYTEYISSKNVIMMRDYFFFVMY